MSKINKKLGTWQSRFFGDEARSWGGSGRCWFGANQSTTDLLPPEAQNSHIHTHTRCFKQYR